MSSRNAKSKTAVKASSSPSNSLKLSSPNNYLSKPKKVYKSNSSSYKRPKSIVKLTIGGPFNGMFAFGTIEYENGKGGFLTGFHKIATAQNRPGEMDEFNIRYRAAPMMRKNHEGNDTVGNGYFSGNGKEYQRSFFIACPPAEKRNEDGTPTEEFVEELHDYVVGTICADSNSFNKEPAKDYVVPYKKDTHNMSKKGESPPLDHLITDESVHDVIQNYILDEDDINDSSTYDTLKKKGGDEFLNKFFSRKAISGKYCTYAIENLGFPNDKKKKE